MTTGHYCDNCEAHLDPDDYVSYGSWSYTCSNCGFSYRHGYKTTQEQVDKFNGKEEEAHERDPLPTDQYLTREDYVRLGIGDFWEKFHPAD